MEFKSGDFLFFEFPGRGKYIVRASSNGNTNDGVIPYDYLFFVQIMPTQGNSVGMMMLPMNDVVGLSKTGSGYMSLKKDGDYFFNTIDPTSSTYADLVRKTSGIELGGALKS